MPWYTTTDLGRFDASAGDFLRERPIENTVILTTMHGLRARGPHAFGDEDPVYGWWESPDAKVCGAYLRTPPFPILLSGMPDDAVESLVDIAAGVGELNAERRLAELVAARYQRRTGVSVETGRQLRLYRLDELCAPDPAPSGRARLAEPADRQLLISWFEMFGEEVGERHVTASTVVDDRIGYGGFVLWEDGGAVVSMAGCTRPQAGTVRIGPVFTPVESRRLGYAGAVTADISRRAQSRGDAVVLFTDLANPTSNAIYQRIGYRPVEDRVVISFPASATADS